MLLFILRYKNNEQTLRKAEDNFPKLAVFIPARNEENHLPGCLKSLEALDYPCEKVDFYIGDDNSTDTTWDIISNWAALKNNRHGLRFELPINTKLNGKAIALHEMVKEIEADYFLFTDADCRIPVSWARGMIAAYQTGAGMVTGITKIDGNTWFANMQACDWWLSLGMVNAMSELGFNLTAMGSNLMVDKSAYHDVGGFAAVADSVTEDLALSRKMFAAGYRPIHRANSRLMVVTKPEPSFAALMRQRKRWARGAFTLPVPWKLLLFLQIAFFPAIIICLIFDPLAGAAFWVLKVMVQSIMMRTFAARTETNLTTLNLLSFECYYGIVGCSTVLYYFWPSMIQWKNREYA
jgi:cellulose synthase/poly-beta-1,6-N-acetylglucosamine synthase-like glycosyltransferase